MMPASKHGDPQLGVDIHLCVVPPSPSPVPLPTPHISVVFDPFDYIPYIGATVTVCGMKRATAGTNGMVVHIPPGFPFAPKLPDKDDELFMGSSTVVADGDPFSFIAVPVLGCQVAGMISIPRLKKKGSGKKAMLLPTTFNLAIPTSVVVGGPPTISLMGMAFKGAFAALGKFAKSGLFKRIRQKAFGFLPPGLLKCKILRAEPVNILTGEVSVQQADFTLPGRIPIEWGRAYASGNDHEGLCGHGWETIADTRLEIDPLDGVVSMHHPTVGPLLFGRLPLAQGDEAGELEMVDGALLTDHGPEYRIRTKEDRVYHFPKGFARINQRGALEYPVGRIADLCGNWWDFDRHGDRLTGINESAGRRIDLEMENGRIKEVALRVPGTDVRHTFVRYEYDQAGDLVTAIDALGHAYRFAYDEHHLVRHTDRNGLSFHYEYDKEGEDWRVVHSWGDGGLYNYHFEYIDLLKERRITDSLGHVSIVKLDDRGLPICETDALGGRTIYEYDDAGRTAAVVDQDGHRTQFAYDDHGNLVELTRPDGGKILTEFDSSNKATAVVDPGGAVWRQLWDVRGLLIEQTTPLGNISRYEYDAAGRLVTYVNPRGSRTELSLDEVGNLAGVKDALGHATLFTYDVLGNVTARRDPLGRRTLYRYDARSQLVEIVLPSGARVGCAYDGEGDLNRYVDERGVETRLQYQGLGELARRIQGDGSTVHYHYDTEERLVGVTNERGERYDIERDAIGRIVRERDYWGQVRHSRYSAAGHIQQIVDPLGRAVSYVTDPLSRVVRKVLPDPDGSSALWEERFSYDANGNLVACANPHIAIERRVDLEGRLLEERQGDRFTIWNTYDEVGNRTARTTEVVHDGARSSHRIGFAYDPLDQVTSIAINDHPPIAIERDVAGQIVAERLNAVLVREIGYTADGLRSRQRVKGGPATVLDVGYAYDAVGNLTARTETGYGTDRYTYDPLGRVTDHLDPLGRLTQYLNDPAGDRLRTRIVEREVVRSARDVRGPDMLPSAGEEWAREGEYKGTSFGFDRAGNLVERRDHDGHLTLRWDANQRLIESRIDGTTTRYRYDPLGRRIDKQTGEGRTEFAWDGDALVGDSVATKPDGTSAASIREWVYFPDTHEPVALLDGTPGSESILHYHNDPNGCPTTLTDGSGQVKWAAAFTVWGEVAALREHAVDNPIRFQGQYYDSETGFAYNRFRYYSCALGQFIGDDPLRLVAGDNLNWWAPNALRWIDPLGLTCKAIALGKDIPGGGLKGLAQQQGASWWRHWAKDGVTRRTVDNRFGRAFHQAADRAEHIHFSLDGIDHVADAVKAGRAGFKPGNFTHAELAHLASRPDLLEKTTFYRAGQVVPSPF